MQLIQNGQDYSLANFDQILEHKIELIARKKSKLFINHVL